MAATARMEIEVRTRRMRLVLGATYALAPVSWLLSADALHAIYRRLVPLMVVEWRFVGARRWRRAGNLTWHPPNDDDDDGAIIGPDLSAVLPPVGGGP